MNQGISIVVLLSLGALMISPCYGQEAINEEGSHSSPDVYAVDFDPTSEDVTSRIIDLFFDGMDSSLSEIERNLLHVALKSLSDRDLLALARGVSPESYSMTPMISIDETEWRSTVAAYAQAILADRSRSSDRVWAIAMLFVGTFLGVAGTLTTQQLARRLSGHA